ncbi:MAG: tetratricopeptide repeat protein [Phycisphaerae bacterium]
MHRPHSCTRFPAFRLPIIPILLILAWSSPSHRLSAAPVDKSDAASSLEVGVQSYLSGNGLLNRGLYDLAAIEYRKFLNANPDHEKAPTARYGLAVSLFRLGKLDEAASELKPLRKLGDFPYAAEVATMHGQCHLAERHYDQAIEAFQVVLDHHAEHPLADDAAALLIEAHYQAGHVRQASQQADAFITKWPRSPHGDRADYFGGLADMKQQSTQAAARRFARLLEKQPDGPFAPHSELLLAQCRHRDAAHDEAARHYRKVLNRADSPYLPDALLGLGTLLRQTGKPEVSAPLLDRLLKTYPKHPLAAEATLLRGRLFFDKGQYAEAKRAFDQVQKASGSITGEAAYWAAKCTLRRKDFVAAAKDLKQAIDQYDDHPWVPEMVYDRAIALLRNGNDEAAIEALKDFRSRFDTHPLAPDALHLLAATLHRQRDYNGSQKQVRAFLKAYPKHALVSKIAFLSAENAYLKGDLAKAESRYRRFLDAHANDANAPLARYRLGMALYHQQKLDESFEILKTIEPSVEKNTPFEALDLAMGDIQFQREDWKPCIQRLNTYLADGLKVAGADDAVLKLGIAHARLGQHEAAIRQYDRLLKHFDDSPHRRQAAFERGQSLVALDRFTQAARAFETVLSENDTDRFATPARRHLAAIASRQGDSESAAELYAAVARASKGTDTAAGALFQQARALTNAKQFKEAEKALRRLIERYPSDRRLNAARARLVLVLARQGKYKEAIDLAEKVDAAALDPSLRPAMIFERAWCLRATGKAEDAAKVYDALIQTPAVTDELLAHALLELGGIQSENEEFQSALKLLNRLRDIIGRTGEMLPSSLREQASYRLGTCHFKLKHYADTARVLEPFVKQFPQSEFLSSAAFFCGESLFNLGRHAEAVGHFDRILQGDNTDPLCAPSLLRLGECQAKLQRWALSEQRFGAFLTRFGDSPQWYQAEFGIGWARENQGLHDEAVEAYRRVIARHTGPTAARAQFQIGQCLFAKKQYEEAVRELLKVDILYAYPEWSAAALFEAGRCFEKLSKTVEARRQFQTVVDKYKETRWAEPASMRLVALADRSLPGRSGAPD